MVDQIPVMFAAVVASRAAHDGFFANPIGRVVSTHPTLKVLALAFLFVIGSC
jgi:predicted tellurium resistance membrane protein TerC